MAPSCSFPISQKPTDEALSLGASVRLLRLGRARGEAAVLGLVAGRAQAAQVLHVKGQAAHLLPAARLLQRPHVVHLGGRRGAALLEAVLAQGLRPQLPGTQPPPPLRSDEAAVLGAGPARLHGQSSPAAAASVGGGVVAIISGNGAEIDRSGVFFGFIAL